MAGVWHIVACDHTCTLCDEGKWKFLHFPAGHVLKLHMLIRSLLHTTGIVFEVINTLLSFLFTVLWFKEMVEPSTYLNASFGSPLV